MQAFDDLCDVCLTKDDKPRVMNLTNAQRAALPALDISNFQARWEALCEALISLRVRSTELTVRQLNLAVCGWRSVDRALPGYQDRAGQDGLC